MFIDSWKVSSTWGKEQPVMPTREELKKNTAEKNGKNYLFRPGEEPRKIGKKRAGAANP